MGLSLLNDTVQNKLIPDVINYSVAISACEKGKHWQATVGLLQEMLHSMMAPSVVSYNTAIRACEKHKERALGLLPEILRKMLMPDVISYNASISACEKGSSGSKCLACWAGWPASPWHLMS